MNECGYCGTDYESRSMEVARSPSVPDGITTTPDHIAIWLRCPTCGDVLVEIYDRVTGTRIRADRNQGDAHESQ